MNLPDCVFQESAVMERYIAENQIRIDVALVRLADVIRKSAEPVDYEKISRLLNLPLTEIQINRTSYFRPDIAKLRVEQLLKKYPGEFKIVRIPAISKKGNGYLKLAVQAARKEAV